MYVDVEIRRHPHTRVHVLEFVFVCNIFGEIWLVFLYFCTYTAYLTIITYSHSELSHSILCSFPPPPSLSVSYNSHNTQHSQQAAEQCRA